MVVALAREWSGIVWFRDDLTSHDRESTLTDAKIGHGLVPGQSIISALLAAGRLPSVSGLGRPLPTPPKIINLVSIDGNQDIHLGKKCYYTNHPNYGKAALGIVASVFLNLDGSSRIFQQPPHFLS